MKFTATLILTVSLLIATALMTAPVLAADAAQSIALPGLGTVQLTTLSTTVFDSATDWESYTTPDGTQLDVENGVYRASTMTPGYAWGVNATEYTDVVLEADVSPLTIFMDTGAGIMCRADTSANGNGYYFMVNGNGYFSIRVGTANGIEPLIDWTASKAVHAGIDSNVIRAVCIEDHLAMYVNDKLVGSVVDNTYSDGFAGLAVAAGDNGVDMAFDNLEVYQPQFTAAVASSN